MMAAAAPGSYQDLPLFMASRPPATQECDGELGKQMGMAQVWDHAGPEFREVARQVLRTAALARPEISANDLWEGLAAQGITTHDNRASGPVMVAAARAGWIARTDRTITTSRRSRHGGDVRVWRSLIYRQQISLRT